MASADAFPFFWGGGGGVGASRQALKRLRITASFWLANSPTGSERLSREGSCGLRLPASSQAVEALLPDVGRPSHDTPYTPVSIHKNSVANTLQMPNT